MSMLFNRVEANGEFAALLKAGVCKPDAPDYRASRSVRVQRGGSANMLFEGIELSQIQNDPNHSKEPPAILLGSVDGMAALCA